MPVTLRSYCEMRVWLNGWFSWTKRRGQANRRTSILYLYDRMPSAFQNSLWTVQTSPPSHWGEFSKVSVTQVLCPDTSNCPTLPRFLRLSIVRFHTLVSPEPHSSCYPQKSGRESCGCGKGFRERSDIDLCFPQLPTPDSPS